MLIEDLAYDGYKMEAPSPAAATARGRPAEGPAHTVRRGRSREARRSRGARFSSESGERGSGSCGHVSYVLIYYNSYLLSLK